MTIELEPLGTLTVTIEQQTVLRDSPQGGLLVGEAAECRWEGDRVRAGQLGRSASDWVRLHAGGSVSVDARILLRTDDGATIAMTYRGKADRPPMAGSSTRRRRSRRTTSGTPGSTPYRPSGRGDGPGTPSCTSSS